MMPNVQIFTGTTVKFGDKVMPNTNNVVMKSKNGSLHFFGEKIYIVEQLVEHGVVSTPLDGFILYQRALEINNE